MGDVSTTTASIINDSIYLQSYHKNLNVTYNDSIRSVDVLVSGCGKLYDKHIVIDESYSGIMSVPDTIYIRSKNVLTVAELNK